MAEREPESLDSLVVLACNRPRALADCLESIARLDWSGRPPEVVVVDDGSLPPCREMVDAFASRMPIVYHYQVNRGVAAARNRGLTISSGNFVAFVADDYRLPADYLRQVDGFFRAHPAAQVISFSVAAAGSSPFRAVQELYQRLALAQQLKLDAPPPPVVESFTLPASRAAVFRRELFDRVGRFDEELAVGEDGDLGRRMAEHGIPVHLFLRQRIEHHEGIGLAGYLRQRLRYGRSFVRVLGGGAARPRLERLGALGVPLCAAAKMREWWTVAGRTGERGRYLVLSPFLFGFLACFYLGALRELREPQPA